MYYDGVKHQNMMELSLSSPVSDIGSASTSSSSQSMSFYVDQNNDSYHQLMDDLSIIDDIYNTYDHEQLNLAIGKQNRGIISDDCTTWCMSSKDSHPLIR